MSIKTKLKQNDTLRRFVKRWKIYAAFLSDGRDYAKYYLESAEKRGHYENTVLLLVHSLEKGMCNVDLRPFGQEKAKRLADTLKSYHSDQHNEFEYGLGCDTLIAWLDFYNKQNQWSTDAIPETVREFTASCKRSDSPAGYKTIDNPKNLLATRDFAKVMLSRFCARDFKDTPIDHDDLDFALQCFLRAPTACNRQMCSVYQVENEQMKELLNQKILGVDGLNTRVLTYFIITYNTAAFTDAGERNQGYINAGLAAMNFVNGLHARGVGSCFLQWNAIRKADRMIRKALGLPDAERIGIIVAAGYYKDQTIVPCSRRKAVQDVFRVLP
jgi:nitroreductase